MTAGHQASAKSCASSTTTASNVARDRRAPRPDRSSAPGARPPSSALSSSPTPTARAPQRRVPRPWKVPTYAGRSAWRTSAVDALELRREATRVADSSATRSPSRAEDAACSSASQVLPRSGAAADLHPATSWITSRIVPCSSVSRSAIASRSAASPITRRLGETVRSGAPWISRDVLTAANPVMFSWRVTMSLQLVWRRPFMSSRSKPCIAGSPGSRRRGRRQ